MKFLPLFFAAVLFLTPVFAYADIVSWYGDAYRGKLTANGERFNPDEFTCASRHYPLGSWLRVSANGKTIFVRVNDRISKRYAHRLDLSRAAFEALAPLTRGLLDATVVCYE